MTIRLLHQTDLFRPYIDPDDHWDLACVYALAALGQLELGGVLVDFPPNHYPGRSPDVTGIAQLSYLTGLPTHMAVGSSVPYTHDRATLAALPRRDRAGAEFLLRYLRDSEGPAYISIVGSCRDLAIAAKLDPDLFPNKCAGIYADTLFNPLRHPYSKALLSAIPWPDPDRRTTIASLEGELPDPLNPPAGCSFSTRCAWAQDKCRAHHPTLDVFDTGHDMRCVRMHEIA